jgi:hypothetical protein
VRRGRQMSGDSRASSYPDTWEFESSDAIRTVYVQRQLYIQRGLAEILLDTLVGRLERVDALSADSRATG